MTSKYGEDKSGTLVRGSVSVPTSDVYATASCGRFEGWRIEVDGKAVGSILAGAVRWNQEEMERRNAGVMAFVRADGRKGQITAFCEWLAKESCWQDGRPLLLPNGTSALDGANASRLIAGAMEGMLWNAGINAAAPLARRGTGQDFVLLDGLTTDSQGHLQFARSKYLVDWGARFTQPEATFVLDLDNAADLRVVHRRYGSSRGWSEGDNYEEYARQERMIVFHLRGDDRKVTCFDHRQFDAVAYVQAQDLDVAVELTEHGSPLIDGRPWTSGVAALVKVPESCQGKEVQSSLPGRTVVQKGGTHYFYGEDRSWTPIPVEAVVRRRLQAADKTLAPYSPGEDGPAASSDQVIL